MPPAVVFLDFDGLMCDTERAAHQSWRDLYARYGLVFPPSVWLRMVGRSDGEHLAAADLSRRLDRPVPAERLDWRRRRKRWLADREPLLPGVAGLLDAAAQRDIPVVVVSSSPRSWVNGHLTRLGAADRLAFLVTGEDAVSHKPAPDLYLAALSRAGVAARTAVALEDSPSGVQAARGAGVPCVAVAGSGGAAGTRYDLTAADLVLDSVERFDLDSPVLAERM